MEQKRLEIIIGDDAFADPFVNSIFNSDYIPRLKEGISGYDVHVTTETNPDEVMRNAAKYDVVVTDLDYSGDGCGEEGFDVIDAVSRLEPRPLIILCTSSDNEKRIALRIDEKADYNATRDSGVSGHKFDSLIKVLIQHYKTAQE